jgi:NAD(P)-dependent dehydrogenase (short-subunit alcohol dehydrogenase family)
MGSIVGSALVTGAQQGIGAATAIALARQGYAVAVNWLDDEAAADAVVATIIADGGEAVAVKGDVSKAEDVQRMLAETTALGPLGVLVNNAAVFPRKLLLEMTDEEWDFVLGINLRGTFLCLREAARIMVAQGTGGAIVNISSGAAYQGGPRSAHYSTTKAGVLGLMRVASKELAAHGIRVNAVAPGLVDTAQPRYGLTEDEIGTMSAATPIGHMAQPADIADVVAFLCSKDSRHMTGQVLHVNGGSYNG